MLTCGEKGLKVLETMTRGFERGRALPSMPSMRPLPAAPVGVFTPYFISLEKQRTIHRHAGLGGAALFCLGDGGCHVGPLKATVGSRPLVRSSD